MNKHLYLCHPLVLSSPMLSWTLKISWKIKYPRILSVIVIEKWFVTLRTSICCVGDECYRTEVWVMELARTPTLSFRERACWTSRWRWSGCKQLQHHVRLKRACQIRNPLTATFNVTFPRRWFVNSAIRYQNCKYVAWLLGSRVRISLRAWMFVSCVCCVLCR